MSAYRYKVSLRTVDAERLTAQRKLITPHGLFVGEAGDWLVTERLDLVTGSQVIMKDDLFQAVFEPAAEEKKGARRKRHGI